MLKKIINKTLAVNYGSSNKQKKKILRKVKDHQKTKIAKGLVNGSEDH